MKTKLLITFEAVARLKSFSAAAQTLNTVQPAVSRQISDLEQTLGVQLFWRTTRDVKLTPAGEALLEDARDILARHSQAEQRVLMAARGQVGKLRLGYLESASYKFLPALIRQYSKLYPDVHISLEIMTAREQIDAFEAGRIDIGLSRPLPASENLSLSHAFIYNDSLMAFLPTGHAYSGRKNISLKDLKSENFIQFNRAGAKNLFDSITAACLGAGFSPTITHQPAAMQTVLTMVASGLGISIAPGCIRDLYPEGCICLPIKDELKPIALEMHYDGSHENLTVRNFAALMLESQSAIQQAMMSPRTA